MGGTSNRTWRSSKEINKRGYILFLVGDKISYRFKKPSLLINNWVRLKSFKLIIYVLYIPVELYTKKQDKNIV